MQRFSAITFKIWWHTWWLAVVIVLVAFLLRSYQLGQVPHGLTWDEAAIGYNGFAVVTTRYDEWLKRLPISFRSFGDYKAPLAIYLNGVFSTVLGWMGFELQPWVIRLPFMLSGIIAVIGVIFLTDAMLAWLGWTQGRSRRWLSLATAAWLAISPWHLHFTRTGFESGLATTFIIWAAWLWFQALQRDDWKWWTLSALTWSASLYTYHSSKIMVPALVIVLALSCGRQLLKQWKQVLPALIVGGLSLGPLVFDMVFGAGLTRAGSLIFSRVHSIPEFLSVFGHNLLAHFSLQFWVQGATTTLRHSDSQFGVVYWWDLLALGLAVGGFAYRRWQKATINLWDKWVIVGFVWTGLGLLPAILGDEVPHPNRALLAVVGVGWLAIAGWYYGLTSFKFSVQKTKTWLSIIVAGYLVSLLIYQSFYYTIFTKTSTEAFLDGYLAAAEFAVQHEKAATPAAPIDKILFSNRYGEPYVYVLLARHTGPFSYQGGALIKYEFTDKITIGDLDRPNTLIIASEADSIPEDKADQLIKGQNGQIRFKLYLPKKVVPAQP